MKTFKIELELKAADSEQAQQKADAIKAIIESLSDTDLIELARLLKKNPSIVATAKRFLG